VFEKIATGKWQELRWGLCLAIAENRGAKARLIARRHGT
jgi:hypothetical protein